MQLRPNYFFLVCIFDGAANEANFVPGTLLMV
jgi:hypothetical protein